MIIILLFLIALINLQNNIQKKLCDEYFSIKVFDTKDKDNKYQMLVQIHNKIEELLEKTQQKLQLKLGDEIDVVIFKRLSFCKQQWQDIKIKENQMNTFTQNKGEKLEICMNSELNTMMYVIIHEVSHILCPEFGHTQLFENINQRMLWYALRFGIYQYEDYTQNPRKFGQIQINYNILGKRMRMYEKDTIFKNFYKTEQETEGDKYNIDKINALWRELKMNQDSQEDQNINYEKQKDKQQKEEQQKDKQQKDKQIKNNQTKKVKRKKKEEFFITIY